MIEQQVTINNRLGLHARAAAKLVRCAGAFDSQIKLERVDRSAAADAKSILSLLMLAARRGAVLMLTVEGEDEQAAAGAICKLFASGFGEQQVGAACETSVGDF